MNPLTAGLAVVVVVHGRPGGSARASFSPACAMRAAGRLAGEAELLTGIECPAARPTQKGRGWARPRGYRRRSLRGSGRRAASEC